MQFQQHVSLQVHENVQTSCVQYFQTLQEVHLTFFVIRTCRDQEVLFHAVGPPV